ncbi:MAG: hypothetical protein ACKVZ0_17740 [Gemmatimonadales bacterium]
MIGRSVVGAVLAVGVARAEAQVRAGVVGAPAVGKAAPALVLPYFTGAGAGPHDQPFRLGAELGRSVVLVFGPATDSTRWRLVGALADSSWTKAVVAGAVRGTPAAVGALAGVVGSERLKLLADSTGRGHRRFGVRAHQWTVFVVDDAGRVAFRAATDPTAPPTALDIAGAIDRSQPPR